MRTEPELLNERLERLAIVLDEIMPRAALLVRDALDLLKEQDEKIKELQSAYGYLQKQFFEAQDKLLTQDSVEHALDVLRKNGWKQE